MVEILKNFYHWMLDTINISNIETFAITIFGIGVTVFTVIYSFVSSKYELINSLREKINNGKASIEDQAQYKIALRFVNKQIAVNRQAIIVSSCAFLLFIACKIKNLWFIDNSYFQFALDILYIVLIIGVGVMIGLVIRDYHRQIKQ